MNTNEQALKQSAEHTQAVERIAKATEIIKEACELLGRADSTYTTWEDQHELVKHIIVGAMLDFSNLENQQRISDLEAENKSLHLWFNGAEVKLSESFQQIKDLEATVKMQREAFQEIRTWLLNNKHNGLESEIGIICKKQLYGED